MIKERFYPTTINVYTEVELTDNINNLITQYGAKMSDPYLMGYIPNEELPDTLKATKVTIDSENRKIIFEPYDLGNIPWGYVSGIANKTYLASAYWVSVDEDGSNVKGSCSFSFINKCYMHKFNNSQYGSLYCYVIKDGNSIQYSDTRNVQIYTSISDLNKWMNGEISLNISLPYGQSGEVYYNIDNNGFLTYESDGVDYKILITGFALSYRSWYNNTNENTSDLLIRQFLKITNPDGRVYHEIPSGTVCSNVSDAPRIALDRSNGFSLSTTTQIADVIWISEDRKQFIMMGNNTGEISFDDIPNYGEGWKFVNDFLILQNTASMTYIYLKTDLSSALGIWDLMNKVDIANETPVRNNLYDDTTSEALFNDENIPLFERYTGNYSGVVRRLQLWQMYDIEISENDFDVDDMPDGGDSTGDDPAPEPDPLPDTSGESSNPQKDRVVAAPTKFITQYVLTVSDVSAIGEKLWSSWLTLDTDIWKNFLFPLKQDTGTFDVTAALDYIISLRVFPYNIPTYSFGHMAGSDGVYMGTGHTNFLNKNVSILSSMCGAVYAGGIDVKPKDGERYNDFRDYYNTSVAVYLPYCGTVELNPVEVMYKHLECTYFVDYQSGACTAILELNDNGVNYMIAAKTGQMGFLIPVTATNAGQLASQFIADATSAVSTLHGFYSEQRAIGLKLAGAMSGAQAATAKGKSSNELYTQAGSLGNEMVNNVFDTGTSLAGQANNMLSRSGINIPMLSGGAGFDAFMMPASPMLMIRRGKYSVPKNFAHSVGYRYTESGRVGDIKGYAEFVNVDVSGINCHEDEKNEIKRILESGVFV